MANKFIITLSIITILVLIGCQPKDEVQPVVDGSQNIAKETVKISEEIDSVQTEEPEIEDISEEQEEVAETLANISNESTAPATNQTITEDGKAHIIIKNLLFVPSSLTVKVNTPVVWEHKDDYRGLDTLQHKITIYGVGSSQIMRYGDTYEYTFKKPGTYVFVDSIHKDTPQGKIIVEP